jgi:uncharacterized membrane protein
VRIAIWLHLLGVIVWVGGMFFAHMALRPAAQALDPPQRLTLLAQALRHFFRWVTLGIAAILLSGAWLIAGLGGFGAVGAYVHLMTTIGVVMVAIFGYIVVAPYRRLVAAVGEGAWERGGKAMGQIRRYVGINLILGLVTTTIAVLGHGF